MTQLKCICCNKPLVLTQNKKTSNVTKSQYSLSNPRCRECVKKSNAKNNPKLSDNDKRDKLNQMMIKNRTPLQQNKIHEEILRHLQLNPRDVHIKYNSQYIDKENIKTQIDINIPCAIQSVMGTGKTKYIIEIISQALKTSKQVIYICPNISTIEDTQEQLLNAGIDSVKYTDTIYFDNPKVVLSTVDSCEQYLDRDILIVDEAYTVFEEMAFKTVQNDEAQIRLLSKYHKIMSHSKPFILDRYIKPPMKLFNAFQQDFQGCSQPFVLIQNLYKKPKQINTLLYNRQQQVKNEIKKIIKLYPDESIAVHFSEERSARQFAKEIDLEDIALYTSKKKEDIKNKKIKITTSSLSRGYSLKADSTYLIDSGRTVGVMTLLQMIDRARGSKAINLYIKDGTNKNKALNTLYNKYKQLDSYDQMLRIKEFLRMIKKMENSHKEVLQFMIIDTYDIGTTQTLMENIYDISFMRSIIDSSWSIWNHEGTDTEQIIKMLQTKTQLSESTIINALKLKYLLTEW